MKQAIWRWTKRGLIGVIALALLVVVAAVAFIVFERHRFAQFNRTHERPLLVDPSDPVLVHAHRFMGMLKPVSSSNSLRFVVMPSFGKRWFAVSVEYVDGKGTGEAVVVRPDGSLISHRSFSMPLTDLDDFLDQWDAVSDGYSGEGRMLTDGNPLVFERRRGERFTSGEGNSPCHYDALGDWAAQQLSAYVPELSDLRQPSLPMLLVSGSCRRSIFDLR